MEQGRFTVAGSMGLVALAALGLAALRRPCPLAASLVYSLVLAALIAAAVAAISRPGRTRAVWGSFAFCGSVYLGLSLGGDAGMLDIKPPATILTALIDIAHDLILRRSQHVHKMGAGVEFWFETSSIFSDVELRPFLQIAHSFAALVVATAGAILASRLARPGREGSPTPPPSTPGDHP